MAELRKVRLVAVDCDGVLINDTYLAVIERFISRHGGDYDEQAERRIVGLRDVVVADLIAELCGLEQSNADTLAAIWAEREQYLREHPIRVNDGVPDLLASLRKLDVRVVCYGGRTREHTFDKYLGHLVDLLDPEVPYVSVNEHRPGIEWIVREVIGCAFDEAVFIDDVSRVAEAAREHGTGFIGFPGGPAHRRQRRFMAEAGVRHIVGSLDEITPQLLARIDDELATSEHWSTRR
ncbi:HAD family hydrolase [Planosporangium thailandense]|uniref:HAD family hydrolase n=1 Tax=Planosporangium thailandense TaxID=765197 RepID=A0ABX0XXM9_9ACTN|nr:HAD family hydrolase [Planosporangium thailandense]NJC69919.1 HAD family hydrolase [Planosporangium thailandense]